MSFIFQSERLGFRNWLSEDFSAMHAVSSDPEVMKFFPSTKTESETQSFIERMQRLCNEKAYCYFPAIFKSTNQVIGFIGICDQNFEAPFNPSIDIGWRIHKDFWNLGLATEGAKACLNYAFEILKIEEIVSVAPVINTGSINVMKKIGMQHSHNFDHPLLLEHENLKTCALFKISNKNF